MSVLKKLGGGDLRSIGAVDQVVKDVLNNPTLFSEVFAVISSENPLIRMRAADAAEKVSRTHPEYLKPYISQLIGDLSKSQFQISHHK